MTIRTVSETCPICEQGKLSLVVGEQEVEHMGRKGVVEYHYLVCRSCGSEQASALQLRMNKRKMKRWLEEG